MNKRSKIIALSIIAISIISLPFMVNIKATNLIMYSIQVTILFTSICWTYGFIMFYVIKNHNDKDTFIIKNLNIVIMALPVVLSPLLIKLSIHLFGGDGNGGLRSGTILNGIILAAATPCVFWVINKHLEAKKTKTL